MKIIFLDIDGVLNNMDAIESERCTMGEGMWNGDTSRSGSGFDPRNMEQLSRILEATDAHIVISSSWRKLHDLDELRAVFANWGIDPEVIIGATPSTDRGHRGQEINIWLNSFGRNGRQVHQWAAIDDDSDFHSEQPLFKTSFQWGLTAEIADQIIEHLNSEP